MSSTESTSSASSSQIVGGEAELAEEKSNAASSFVEEAKSIQALLREYQERNEALKTDLTGFVHREIDEHAQLLHLRAAVDQAELAGLQNSEYVQFAAQRAKGLQSIEKRKGNRGGNAALEGVVREELPHDDQEKSGTASVLEKPDWELRLANSSSPWLRKWLPDAVVPLQDKSDIAHVWLGWKGVSESATEAFYKLTDSIYASSNSQSHSSGEKTLVCFGNGALCTAIVERDAQRRATLEESAGRLVKAATKFCPAQNTTEFSDFLAHKVAWTAALYNTELCCSAAMSRAAFARCMWPDANGSASHKFSDTPLADELHLSGDGKDVLTLVKPERLQHTLMLRAFFFSGSVGLVEQLGVEADMTLLMLPSTQKLATVEEARSWVRRHILQTLRTLYAGVFSEGTQQQCSGNTYATTNVAFTVAFKLPALGDDLYDGVLLDVHPISPQLSFKGRTTWMEVCAIGRQRGGFQSRETKQHASTNAACESIDDAEKGVVFRLSYLPVASLQPYDPISCRVFPLLNKALHIPTENSEPGRQPVTTTSSNKPLAAAHSSFSAGTALICFGAASCVVAALGVWRWLPRR